MITPEGGMDAVDALWRDLGVACEWITLDGLRVRHVVHGQGRNVILLQGFACSLEDWVGTIRGLGSTYCCHALEYPGSGLSMQMPREYTLHTITNLVLEYMARLRLASASFVGLSLGAGVALSLALRAPDQVESLVLVSPALLGRRTSLFLHLATLPGIGELLLRPSRRTVHRYLDLCSADANRLPEPWVRAKEELAQVPGVRGGTLKMLRSGMGLFGVKRRILSSLVGRLDSVDAPTLILYGARDAFIPERYCVRAAEVMKRAKRVRLADAGHCLALDQEERFLSLVTEFLDAGGG
jgi:pimeloyl-ACP methyl ester carboxylesterase